MTKEQLTRGQKAAATRRRNKLAREKLALTENSIDRDRDREAALFETPQEAFDSARRRPSTVPALAVSELLASLKRIESETYGTVTAASVTVKLANTNLTAIFDGTDWRLQF